MEMEDDGYVQKDDEHYKVCHNDYNPIVENIKLAIQLVYLILSAIFMIRVIYVVGWKCRTTFRNNSFFNIFLIDCFVGLLLILSSIFFYRPIMYIPQICAYISHVLLFDFPIFLDVYQPIFRYLQAFQILIQMLSVANRASCVLVPVSYAKFWRKNWRRMIIIVGMVTFIWVWNLAVSEKLLRHAYGGLVISFNKRIGFGLLLLLIDIFIARFFVYFPQLCQSASHFFQSHRLIMDVYYPLLNYLHCAQPLIQIFLTTNRASSVLWPVEHNKKWARKLPFIIAFVSLSPILFIWNTIVSTKIIVYYFGGFFIIGVETISWADVNVFLFVIRSMTVGVTVISTTVMFKGMSKMKNRMKKSEKVLCVASAINSVCFMVPSFFEALAFFSEVYGNSWINFLVQPFAWDVLNVGHVLTEK
uniref:Serpentine receptor class gamma n=1 Tax=Caenorhabditis japonica TaxID=281687 RepID=A0A8R1DW09_CAEJA